MFVGGAAAAFTLASFQLVDLPANLLGHCAALAFFFILAQHLLNQYTKREAMYLNEPDRGAFFQANAGTLRLLAIGSGVLALFLAFLLGWLVFGLVLAGTVAGILYCLPARLGIRVLSGFPGLQHIPGSKELSVGMAWGATTVLVPVVATDAWPDSWPAAAIVVGFSFLLAFERTLLTDLRDVEGDQLVGRETLAVVIGKKPCQYLAAGVIASEGLLIASSGLLGWTPALSFGMLLAVAYGAMTFLLFHSGRLPRAELGEALIDGKFYLCGLLAAAGYLA